MLDKAGKDINNAKDIKAQYDWKLFFQLIAGPTVIAVTVAAPEAAPVTGPIMNLAY